MKKMYMILVVMVVSSLLLVPTAFASTGGTPAGGCSSAFELHALHHIDEHHHPHIGVDRDLNGDGYICMKSLPNNLHLIVDNANILPKQ